jgi:hypothetical protein
MAGAALGDDAGMTLEILRVDIIIALACGIFGVSCTVAGCASEATVAGR